MTAEEIGANNEKAREAAKGYIFAAMNSVRDFIGSNQVQSIVERLQQLHDEIDRM